MARVFIYDNKLQFLDELVCRTERSWRLNALNEQFAAATAYVSILDSKLDTRLLHFRNIMIIHDGILPDFAGQIGEPEAYGQSEIAIGATAAEIVFDDRTTDGKFRGTAGQIFADNINAANANTPTGVILGDVEEGDHMAADGMMSALDRIKYVQYCSGMEWGVDAFVDPERPQIPTLTAWLRARTGLDLTGESPHMELNETTNIEFEASGAIMTKTGRVKNEIHVSAFSAKQERAVYTTVRNQDSIDAYGLAQAYINLTNGSQQAVDSTAAAQLAALSYPHMRFALTINDTAMFPYLRIGNRLSLKLVTTGFQDGRRGYEGPVRIIGMAYDDMENKVALTVEDVITP